jgi:hypothetical protein
MKKKYKVGSIISYKSPEKGVELYGIISSVYPNSVVDIQWFNHKTFSFNETQQYKIPKDQYWSIETEN